MSPENPDSALKMLRDALNGSTTAAEGLKEAMISTTSPPKAPMFVFTDGKLTSFTPDDPPVTSTGEEPWQLTSHGECDCVPDLGPSHCHLCAQETDTKAAVPWIDAPCNKLAPFANSPFPKTCRMIAALGIDPNLITVDDIDVNGYWTLVLDENGHKAKTDEGMMVVRHHRWPSMHEGIAIVDQYIKEKMAGR